MIQGRYWSALRNAAATIGLVILGSSGLFSQGLAFTEASWPEVLAMAQSQGKIIFLDAVTTWCGPCKQMAANVFPDTAVGRFFNRHFINVKMDMERGEGVELAQRYGIDVYPTLLFLNDKGQIQHRISGYHNAQELLKTGARALDPQTNLAGLISRYKAGERTPDLLLQFAEAKANALDPTAGDLAHEYLKTQQDWSSPQNMGVIMRYVDNPYSPGFIHLVRNRIAFEKMMGERAVNKKIESVFDHYIERNPQLQLGEVQRLYGACYPERGERMASAYRLSWFRQKDDMPRFAEAAIDHYNRYPSDDSEELTEIAGLFLAHVTDRSSLEKALHWAETAVTLQESWQGYDTLARLYQKTEQRKKAKAAAKKAISLAEKNGESAEETRKFLEEL